MPTYRGRLEQLVFSGAGNEAAIFEWPDPDIVPDWLFGAVPLGYVPFDHAAGLVGRQVVVDYDPQANYGTGRLCRIDEVRREEVSSA